MWKQSEQLIRQLKAECLTQAEYTELVEVDGRRLVFDVAAYDAKGKIGGGRHERFIIQNEKFQAKANKKALAE